MQENSFGGILTTYCVAIVVLSILDIPEIVIPELIVRPEESESEIP